MSEETQEQAVQEPTQETTPETTPGTSVEAVAEPAGEVTPPSPPEEKVPVAALKSERSKRQEWEREAAYWRQKALDREQPAQPVAKQPTDPAPKEDDFADYVEYQRALTRWEVRQEMAHEAQRSEEKRRQDEARRKQADEQTRIASAMAKGADAHDDFDELVRNPSLALTNEMVSAAVETELGNEILYYLASNPTEAQRIASLPTQGQYREIGKLEAKLSTPAQKQTTKAPEPIKPVSSSGNVAEKDPAKMSDQDYTRWRRERLKSRRY